MTEDQFDDSLKNKIREHRSPVPDDMWERIIQKKDKDRKGFLFFFGGFILVFGVCLGGYLLMNHAKPIHEAANHTLSRADIHAARTTPGLIKERAGSENDSIKDAQQRAPSKKRSNSSQAKTVSNPHKGIFNSYDDQKLVSATSAGGVQNSSSQTDSPAGGKEDSVLNATGIVNKPVPVVKPVPEKRSADTAKNSAVRKTQRDSAIVKKWYLDIYASPDLPLDHTEISFSSMMRLSYTFGLRINRAFGKHFSGKIGIQYSRINFGAHDSISYWNGEAKHLNSFDLPFLAGYSFGDEKLKMTLTAGGIYNISTSVPDSSFASYFKKNTGFSLYLGFNLEKKMNQKISVYLEPYYRYRLTSMSISSVEVYKFIDVAGLSFGARYYFLKSPKK